MPITDTQPDAVGDEAAIRLLVSRRTGRTPRQLSILETPRGRVVFLTVAVDDTIWLAGAQRIASQLDEDIRRDRSDLADVVVHTEPTAGTGSS